MQAMGERRVLNLWLCSVCGQTADDDGANPAPEPCRGYGHAGSGPHGPLPMLRVRALVLDDAAIEADAHDCAHPHSHLRGDRHRGAADVDRPASSWS